MSEEYKIERNDFRRSIITYVSKNELLARLYAEGVRDHMNLDELKDYIIWELLYFIDCNSRLRTGCSALNVDRCRCKR